MAFTRANVKTTHGQILVDGSHLGFTLDGMQVVFGDNTFEEPLEESGNAPGAIFYAGDNIRFIFSIKEDISAVRSAAFPGRVTAGAIDVNDDRLVGDDAIADSVVLTYVPTDGAKDSTITVPKAVLIGKPSVMEFRATAVRIWSFEYVGVPDSANSGRVMQYS